MALMMQEGSEPALQADSHLFIVPATYTDFIRTESERILPASGVTEELANGDLTFFIPASSSFLSLADICLEFEASIKKRTATGGFAKITDADKVAPVNNFAHSLWKSVQVTLTNRVISDAGPTYAYRAYLETLLHSNKETLESQGQCSGFYRDTPDKFADHDGNISEKTRKARFVTSEWVSFSARPNVDLFQQSKNLIPGAALHLRFIMNNKDFVLRNYSDAENTDEFKVFIRNPRLYVKRLIPNPSYLAAVSKQLAVQPVKYHIERVVMRYHDVPKSVQGTTIANIHIGPLPKVVYVAMVDSEAFHGTKGWNPFDFQHFGINHLSVEAEGICFPTKPYTLTTKNSQWLEPYSGLLETLQRKNEGWGALPFALDDWGKGYAIFGADLTPGSTGRGPMSLVRQGNLSLRIQFDEPLKKVAMVIVYMVFDNIVEINQHRQLIADFTA